LTKEHGLDESETDKPLLDAEDFLEVLRCHWVTDTNFFPYERYRLYVATILLLAALTGSRPGALLGITYGDIDLFVLRDKKTGEVALALQLRLRKTKSRQKRKRPCGRTHFRSRRDADSHAGRPIPSFSTTILCSASSPISWVLPAMTEPSDSPIPPLEWF